MIEAAKRTKLLFPPGSQPVCSSSGYSVLARVLELAGGRPYEDLLEEIVLAPTGAVHSIYNSWSASNPTVEPTGEILYHRRAFLSVPEFRMKSTEFGSSPTKTSRDEPATRRILQTSGQNLQASL